MRCVCARRLWTRLQVSRPSTSVPTALPEDIWRHIASFMDGKSARDAAAVCRVLAEQARVHEDLVTPPLVVGRVVSHVEAARYDNLFGSDSEDDDDLPGLVEAGGAAADGGAFHFHFSLWGGAGGASYPSSVA